MSGGMASRGTWAACITAGSRPPEPVSRIAPEWRDPSAGECELPPQAVGTFPVGITNRQASGPPFILLSRLAPWVLVHAFESVRRLRGTRGVARSHSHILPNRKLFPSPGKALATETLILSAFLVGNNANPNPLPDEEGADEKC
jgi:hypothetical protein